MQKQIMNTKHLKTILGGLLAFLFCAALQVHAQQRGGGGGGFGGFGGFGGGGGGGGNRGNSTSGGQYNPNGTVGGATMMVDPDTKNLIVVTDEETSKSIDQVIRSLDRPKAQVLIKVVFLDVLHASATDIGVEGTFGNYLGGGKTNTLANVFGLNGLNSITTNFNVAGPAGAVPALTQTPPGAGMYQLLGSDFQATLRAIAQAGKAQLLSRPSILVRDGQPATITVGQSVPLITSVTYSGVLNTPVNNVTYTDVGIILKVTPYISPDGYIEMIVSPQNSAISATQTEPIAIGVNAPVIDISSADTVIVTPDLQTVVIGGLMRNDKAESVSKIPILGDIPGLGVLFRRKTTSGTKTELIIFMTPHIVRAPSQLAALGMQEQKNMLTPKSYSEEELDRFLEKVPMKKN
jgi:type II secretory pathway component GspD/PulD (secretin)